MPNTRPASSVRHQRVERIARLTCQGQLAGLKALHRHYNQTGTVITQFFLGTFSQSTMAWDQISGRPAEQCLNLAAIFLHYVWLRMCQLFVQ